MIYKSGCDQIYKNYRIKPLFSATPTLLSFLTMTLDFGVPLSAVNKTA